MLNRLFSILALTLVTCGTYAATVDNFTLPEHGKLEVRLDARIQKIGIAPAFGSIVKKDATSEKYCSNGSNTGEICYMTQQNAIDYCASQQNHLPSAIEMALLSQSFQAKGLYSNCPNNDSRCYHIRAKNLDQSIDEFNFSYWGYTQPEGDLGNNWFWTSSVDPDSPDVGFIFDGEAGDVNHNYNHIYYSAVRCVAGR